MNSIVLVMSHEITVKCGWATWQFIYAFIVKFKPSTLFVWTIIILWCEGKETIKTSTPPYYENNIQYSVKSDN